LNDELYIKSFRISRKVGTPMADTKEIKTGVGVQE
jgi:hypothetical protein